MKGWMGWIVAGLLALVGVRAWQAEHAKLLVATLHADTLRVLNDSTSAKLAQRSVERDSVAGLYTAAKVLNGQLIAAIRLHVPEHDTTVVHDMLPTTIRPDSTRVAQFRDSTFAGTVAGTATAPPCCAPLQLTYAITRPAFDPAVGLVRVGDAVVATVVWQGERTSIRSSFAKLVPPPKWIQGRAAFGLTTDQQLAGRLGADLRLFGAWSLTADIQQPLAKGAKATGFAGVQKVF